METYLNKSGNIIGGHICDCGANHKWPGYVYAHWDVELIHTCTCGIKSLIINGTITVCKKPKKKKVKDGMQAIS